MFPSCRGVFWECWSHCLSGLGAQLLFDWSWSWTNLTMITRILTITDNWIYIHQLTRVRMNVYSRIYINIGFETLLITLIYLKLLKWSIEISRINWITASSIGCQRIVHYGRYICEPSIWLFLISLIFNVTILINYGLQIHLIVMLRFCWLV